MRRWGVIVLLLAACSARAELSTESSGEGENQIPVPLARQQAEHERVRAEVSAAMQVQVERYADLIRSKIRRKRKAVADVPESAEAVFKVTLLPDGTVMDAVLYKSSGFSAYDDAVERAIRSASPLPLPTDVTLQKMFREIRLSIRP